MLFSYAVSHDLQEPIRKIEFFSGRVLEDENALSPKGKDFLQRIRTSAQKMKQLIENLLSYSIVEGNKKTLEKTDLNQVLLQVQQDLSEQIQQTGAHIQSGQLPGVTGVPSQLHELFMNLLTNSIKFRKQDEALRISIQCDMVKGAGLAHLGAVSAEDYFHISFTDNGIGFEQQYASTIFDILQRLHGQNEYAGTGIGLAICKKVVENHQGFIEAEGEPGKGCTIHIYLPVEKKNLAGYSVRKDWGEEVV
jgi:light-regulated signal transduction histidine kinase (bacteriophytochrome)